MFTIQQKSLGTIARTICDSLFFLEMPPDVATSTEDSASVSVTMELCGHPDNQRYDPSQRS